MSVDELPEIVPLFPLPNVVLFPHVDLPLHVFEPRYREMVRDAMAGDRLIAMVLLRGDWRKDYHGSPAIFPIGCAGRIEQCQLLPDGRSNLVLHGLASFEILEELQGTSYRRARVRWREGTQVGSAASPAGAAPSAGDASAAAVEAKRRRLRTTVTRLLERGDKPVADDLWDRLPSDLDKLVNALGFSLELGVIEKLSLLECSEVALRVERLIEIVEFRLAERGLGIGGPGGEGGEEPWH